MKAIRVDEFGGLDVLKVVELPEPHAGPNQVRVHVSAIGLNPMDWMFTSMPPVAAMLGVTLPSGFATDLAGVIDEVGSGVDGFAVGDRVFGGAMARAAADYVVIDLATDTLEHTPDGISDEIASALPVAARTADAALDAINLKAGETVLIGGATGGVGVFAVQLAKLAGATVIGTASPSSFNFLRDLGVTPVAYGEGLVDRVREIAPDGVDAAASLVGTETIGAALALGVLPKRISSISAGPNPPGGVRATGGVNATPGALARIAAAVAEGTITVPIAATFPFAQLRDAVAMQQAGHVKGKIVVTLE